MSNDIELYANRIQLSRFFAANYPNIYNNIGHSKLVRLEDTNIIQKMYKHRIFREMTRDEADADKYSIPLVVKAIPMTNDGIYLIDEYMGSRKNKVSLLGGHLEPAYYYDTYNENYVVSELVRELREETTMGGRAAWNNLPMVSRTDIPWNFYQCGLPPVTIVLENNWYCNYIELNGTNKGSFTIYIPMIVSMSVYNNPKVITFTQRDFVILRDMHRGDEPVHNIIREFKIDPECDDVRINGFYNVLEPIFNSRRDILTSAGL